MSRARWALLVTGTLACAAPPNTNRVDQRIVGGQPTSTVDYPTTVALEDGPEDWFCTGTLIDKDWVLTAAHCVLDDTAAQLHVRFDDDNLNNGSGGKVVAVAEIHAHPDYDDDSDVFDNDIAVVKLAASVTDRTITPIHRMAPPFGTHVIQVGYGDADNDGGGSGIVRKLTTPTVDCDDADDPDASNANVLCFDASDGNAACFGDSGGPAYVDVGGMLEVAGVTSAGTDGSDKCTVGWDIYTAVAGELAFVDQYVPIVVAPPSPPDPVDPPPPDPMDPAMDPMDPGDPGMGSDGGCSTGSGAGLGAILALGLLVRRRRRLGTG